ncbi:MAG TPA: hypothetical protein VFW45_00185 [Candidatus Polarisedimenticolia bacterium]|nr:hypothetical protein [Candidatus Polarisedimenticolia bacterium]
MQRRLIFTVAWIGMCLLPVTQAQEKEEPEERVELPGLAWLADLAGSCWTGSTREGKVKDTQCYGTQYGRFLRGTIQLGNPDDDPGRSPYEGDSVWAWDPKKKKISFYYWSSAGTFGVSDGLVDGEMIRFPDPPRLDARQPPTRSTWIRLDGNSYKVIREKKIKGAWKETDSVVYTRVIP